MFCQVGYRYVFEPGKSFASIKTSDVKNSLRTTSLLFFRYSISEHLSFEEPTHCLLVQSHRDLTVEITLFCFGAFSYLMHVTFASLHQIIMITTEVIFKLY